MLLVISSIPNSLLFFLLYYLCLLPITILINVSVNRFFRSVVVHLSLIVSAYIYTV